MNINMMDIRNVRKMMSDMEKISTQLRNRKKTGSYTYMVLDIETTKCRHIIQIAYNIYDEFFNVVSKVDNIINEGIGKRDYYERFTLSEIYEQGKDVIDVLLELKKDMLKTKYIICHNVTFDLGNIYRYFNKYNIHISKKPIEVCTMKLSRKLCDCKDKNGKRKNPRLSELYQYCFNELPSTTLAHTADYDVHITTKCFKYLVENNHFILKN